MCFDSENKARENNNEQIPVLGTDVIPEATNPKTHTREEALQKAIDAYVNAVQPNGTSGALRMLKSLDVLEGEVASLCRAAGIPPKEWLTALRTQHPEMVNEAGDKLSSSYFED